jgi:hypothetical protein
MLVAGEPAAPSSTLSQQSHYLDISLISKHLKTTKIVTRIALCMQQLDCSFGWLADQLLSGR